MSNLDEELKMLRANLAVLEEKKRIELEIAAAKKANPLKTIEDILASVRGDIERAAGTRHIPAPVTAKNTVAYLEPIVDMLKNIQDRLDVLEGK